VTEINGVDQGGSEHEGGENESENGCPLTAIVNDNSPKIQTLTYFLLISGP
jgi:hypothetical protein